MSLTLTPTGIALYDSSFVPAGLGVWLGQTPIWSGAATTSCCIGKDFYATQLQLRPGDETSWIAATRRLAEADWMPIAPAGPALRMRGGGDVLAVEWATTERVEVIDYQGGTRTMLPAGCELIDVSPEGVVLCCIDRISGRGLEVFDRHGVRLFTTSTYDPIADVINDLGTSALLSDSLAGCKNARVAGQRLVWADTDGEHEVDLSTWQRVTVAALHERTGYLVPIGARLLLRMSGSRLMLADRESTQGIVLARWQDAGGQEDPSKYCNLPTARLIDGWVQVAFSRLQGTTPDTVKRLTVDPDGPTADLNAPLPPSPARPAPTAADMPIFTRPVTVAVWPHAQAQRLEFGNTWITRPRPGDTPDVILGSAEDDGSLPVVCHLDYYGADAAALLAQVEAGFRAALAKGKGVLLYYDGLLPRQSLDLIRDAAVRVFGTAGLVRVSEPCNPSPWEEPAIYGGRWRLRSQQMLDAGLIPWLSSRCDVMLTGDQSQPGVLIPQLGETDVQWYAVEVARAIADGLGDGVCEFQLGRAGEVKATHPLWAHSLSGGHGPKRLVASTPIPEDDMSDRVLRQTLADAIEVSTPGRSPLEAEQSAREAIEIVRAKVNRDPTAHEARMCDWYRRDNAPLDPADPRKTFPAYVATLED